MLTEEPGPRFVLDDSRNKSFLTTSQDVTVFGKTGFVPKTLTEKSGN